VIDFAAYVSRLRFRWVQPGARLPFGFRRAMRLLARLGPSFEIANTVLPQPGEIPHLRQLCLIPKMSTYAIGAMINLAVARMPPGQAFVNVGVWNGFTFLAGLANHPEAACIGVDNFSEFGGPAAAFQARFERYRSPAHQFHSLDYREYFRRVHQAPIGVYIYDGHHSYDNQLEGLRTAEPFLAPGAILFVDDTNAAPPREATLAFMRESRLPYRLLYDRQTRANRHPTLWNGLMILQREP
jgi:hypothetical protein